MFLFKLKLHQVESCTVDCLSRTGRERVVKKLKLTKIKE